jgi:UDP-N-acetylglucosamine 2-epimerase (non-hydrolysing)
MQITIVAGARPNFIKIAPIIRAIENAAAKGSNITYRLVHTGQHFDRSMSDTFFQELNIPHPDANLECGGGSQAEQTAAIMVAFEKDLLQNRAQIVLVVGDVTSTMACSIVAKKLQTKVAHVEAGIRSYDLTMPEEINRMVTDSISDYFFTTTVQAGQNLVKAGINKDDISFVGNVMIDTLLANRTFFKKPPFFDTLKLVEKQYLVLTLHRPANVDRLVSLENVLSEILDKSQGLPIIFPIHPRTAKVFSQSKREFSNLHIVGPMGYLEFNYLVERAIGVITDSGGITEECTVLSVPCMTLRNNTERPETVDVGTNELIGTDPKNIGPALTKLLSGNWKQGTVPEKWDGKTAERIVQHLLSLNED